MTKVLIATDGSENSRWLRSSQPRCRFPRRPAPGWWL